MRSGRGREKPPGRLRWRLFTQFTAAGLITILILGALYYNFTRRETIGTYTENSWEVIERYERRLEAFFQDELDTLVGYHDLLGQGSLELVVSTLLQDPNYLDSYILDASGQVLYAGDPLLVGYDYRGKDAYQQALKSREPFTIKRFHHTERRLAIDMVIPLKENKGDGAFVAVYQLNPAWLEESITREYFPGEGEIIMFNEDGIIFLSVNSSSPGIPGSAPAKLPSLLDYGFSLPSLQERGEEPRSFKGEDYLVTYRNMSSGMGVIANRMSLAIIWEQFQYVLMLMALGAGLGIVLFAFWGAVVAGWSMKPIYKLSHQVEEALQGGREVVVEDPASELSVLVRAFNQSWRENLQAQQEIQQLTDEYEKVFNGTQDAMALIGVRGDEEFYFIRNNRAYQENTGISLEDIQGRTPREVFGPVRGEELTRHYRGCLARGVPLTVEETLGLPAGERTWATTLTPIHRGENVHFLVSSSQDITGRKIAEEALRLSQERYRLLVDNATEGIGVIQEGITKYVNPMALKMLGCSLEEAASRPILEFIHPQDRPEAAGNLEKALYDQDIITGAVHRLVTFTGEIRWVQVSGVAIWWEDRPAVLTFINDITEQKQNQEKLEYLSLHDGLTGLYNRAFFDEEMRRLSHSREYPVTIIAADLDGLKLINDTLGHPQGDALIRAGASVLRQALRSSDILARMGGDEFAVILPRTGYSTGETIARRISSLVDQYNVNTPALPLGISLGIATGQAGGASLEEIYNKADDMMYRDKLARREFVRSHTVDILFNALGERDYIHQGHGQRVLGLCLTLGDRLGLSASQLIDLAILAQVHDLGMVGVSHEIIFKDGPLAAEEWEIIKQHPEKGHRIALSSPDLAEIAGLIFSHHERWDGSGYPRGLQGEEIPLLSRILAVADAFEVMTSGRPYREARDKKEALAELERGAGKQFDPELVKVFVEIIGNQSL